MTTVPNRRRSALRNLIVVVTAAVVLVVFAYGWTVTDINLARPQEERRQTNVQNALRELLSPNIFAQDYSIETEAAPFLMNCPAGAEPPEAEAVSDTSGAYVVVSPACGQRGDEVTVEGYGFEPNALAQIRWTPEDGDSRPRDILNTGSQTLTTDASGNFTAVIEVPSIRGSVGETHLIEVDTRVPSGLPYLSETTNEVIAKMIETIFLALIATTISILPSVILSFFAARNLMKPVRLTLGNMLVSVALLPVGWALGTIVLGPLASFAFNVGSGAYFGAGATALIVVFASVTTSNSLRHMQAAEEPSPLRSTVNRILFAVLLVLAIALIGGLGVLFGTLFEEGVLGYVSNFIGTLGQLVQLTLVPIAGFIGAFTVSGIGTNLTTGVLKQIDSTTGHVLGGVLGFICGAIVLGAIGYVATQAALLGLLTPLIAAALAWPLLPMVYNRVFAERVRRQRKGVYSVNDTARLALGILGAVLAFYVTFNVLNVGRALVEGSLPPDSPTTILGLTIQNYVVQAMLIGGLLGAIGGLMAGTRMAFPVGSVLYNTTRTTLNALRSIEPLIMGLIFVIWVGIGPFAGVLALTLHSIASLGKLYSEQLENIDHGPIEALESTGANRLQTIMYGAVPQIIPPYIAFTMYRWDINVRMSTIIGFVGGGGIGFLLQQQLNLLRYRDAGVAVLAIAIVVSILDYASASIRERYM